MAVAKNVGPSSVLGSMRPDGARLKLHPLDIVGPWASRRKVVFAALIAIYVLAPLLEVGGHPALWLDVEHRRFYVLGATFNAQDVWLLLLLALSFIFGLLFVTAWRGRVWCGWACPQTVFLEAVYRPIERLIEGPRERRLKLAGSPWTAGRVGRLVLKQALFFGASVLIAHAAAAIFASPWELKAMILDGPQRHWLAFGLTLGFTAVLTFNFAWFREQFCVVLCPYGRLQSVLHDRHSVTVAYDAGRGEPRGKVNPGAPQGDCVDCKKCVYACPTGIDIRNGLQMECLACTQCIDVCDEVMTKVKRPTGLIRFASQAELKGEPRKTLRPRLAVYGALFFLALGSSALGLTLRTGLEANVVRPAGANPFVVDGERVHNTFEVHVFNTQAQPARLTLSVVGPAEATVRVATPTLTLESLRDARVPVAVSLPLAALGRTPVMLELVVADEVSGERVAKPVRFLAPLR